MARQETLARERLRARREPLARERNLQGTRTHIPLQEKKSCSKMSGYSCVLLHAHSRFGSRTHISAARGGGGSAAPAHTGDYNPARMLLRAVSLPP